MASIKKTATKVLLVTLCSCLVIDLTQALPFPLPNHIGVQGPEARVQTDGVGIDDVGNKCKGIVSQATGETGGALSGIGDCCKPLGGIAPGVSGTVDKLPIVGELAGKNGGIGKSLDLFEQLPDLVGGFGGSCGKLENGMGKSVNGIVDQGLQMGDAAQGLAGNIVGSCDDSSNKLLGEASGLVGGASKTCKDGAGGIVSSVSGLTGGLSGGKGGGLTDGLLGGKGGGLTDGLLGGKGGGLTGGLLGGKGGGLTGGLLGGSGGSDGLGGLLGGLFGSNCGKGGTGLNPVNLVGEKLKSVQGLTGGLVGGGSPSVDCNAGVSGGEVCANVNPNGQRCH